MNGQELEQAAQGSDRNTVSESAPVRNPLKVFKCAWMWH